jgi:hypothetical protein
MPGRVLILGNGISRKAFDVQIQAYDGEVWACNNAFREYPEIITRLTGHTEPMVEAQEWKEKHGFKFEIYSGPIAKKFPDWRLFAAPPRWHRDSGTTMVAEALHEGYEVDLVGFDLGGPDVFAFTQYRQDKTCWVNRWAEIVREWGPERLNFWGYDHKPFLMDVVSGVASAKVYSRLYLRRRPHLDDESYKEIYMANVRPETKEERMVRIRYPNGHESSVRESIAISLVGKGHAVTAPELKDAEPEPSIPTPLGGDKKSGPKADKK